MDAEKWKMVIFPDEKMNVSEETTETVGVPATRNDPQTTAELKRRERKSVSFWGRIGVWPWGNRKNWGAPNRWKIHSHIVSSAKYWTTQFCAEVVHWSRRNWTNTYHGPLTGITWTPSNNDHNDKRDWQAGIVTSVQWPHNRSEGEGSVEGSVGGHSLQIQHFGSGSFHVPKTRGCGGHARLTVWYHIQ